MGVILGPSEHHAGELGAPVRRTGTLNLRLENHPATHTQGSAWKEGTNSYYVEPDAGGSVWFNVDATTTVAANWASSCLWRIQT